MRSARRRAAGETRGGGRGAMREGARSRAQARRCWRRAGACELLPVPVRREQRQTRPSSTHPRLLLPQVHLRLENHPAHPTYSVQLPPSGLLARARSARNTPPASSFRLLASWLASGSRSLRSQYTPQCHPPPTTYEEGWDKAATTTGSLAPSGRDRHLFFC